MGWSAWTGDSGSVSVGGNNWEAELNVSIGPVAANPYADTVIVIYSLAGNMNNVSVSVGENAYTLDPGKGGQFSVSDVSTDSVTIYFQITNANGESSSLGSVTATRSWTADPDPDPDEGGDEGGGETDESCDSCGASLDDSGYCINPECSKSPYCSTCGSYPCTCNSGGGDSEPDEPTYLPPSFPENATITVTTDSGEFTGNETCHLSWTDATPENNNSPVVAYLVLGYKRFASSEEETTFDGITTEDDSTELSVELENYNFSSGDVIWFTVQAFTKDGEGNWIISENSIISSEEYTIEEYTIQDNNAVFIKVNGSWQAGELLVKVDGTWKQAEAVYAKTDQGWKQAQ